MQVDWTDSSRGYGPDGHQVAEITHIHGPDGQSHGWSVWLTQRQVELTPRYPTRDDARAAAEQALDPDPFHHARDPSDNDTR